MIIRTDHYVGGALLVLDGMLPPASLLHRLRSEHSPIVAADGAALKLREMSILPDIIIGDLDTLAGEAEGFAKEGVSVIQMPDQDTNDLEKGLAWIAGAGSSTATIVGASGGMTDHTLNNFSVLARHARRLRIRLHHGDSVGYLIHDALHVIATPGDRISLIPLPSAIVSTTGLQWSLAGERLAIGEREGASNRAIAESVQITVSEGVILLIHYAAGEIRHSSG